MLILVTSPSLFFQERQSSLPWLIQPLRGRYDGFVIYYNSSITLASKFSMAGLANGGRLQSVKKRVKVFITITELDLLKRIFVFCMIYYYYPRIAPLLFICPVLFKVHAKLLRCSGRAGHDTYFQFCHQHSYTPAVDFHHRLSNTELKC